MNAFGQGCIAVRHMSREGSRRPGCIVSVEPGTTDGSRGSAFSLSVPVAVVRNRIKSYPDRQDSTGQEVRRRPFRGLFCVDHRTVGVLVEKAAPVSHEQNRSRQ